MPTMERVPSMAGRRGALLTKDQWEMVKPLILEVSTTRSGERFRADERACFEGVFVSDS
ncbi:hypothetical protein DTL36_19055 [Bremerella cremea]|nr:hypothetical protein DTL36_19055 [Bremerella cremea]